MGKQYHTLVFREDKNSPWEIEFGDYDKKVVKEEFEALFDAGIKKVNMKIITTDESQYEIELAVIKLNDPEFVNQIVER